jgi:hypothetical protein
MFHVLMDLGSSTKEFDHSFRMVGGDAVYSCFLKRAKDCGIIRRPAEDAIATGLQITNQPRSDEPEVKHERACKCVPAVGDKLHW